MPACYLDFQNCLTVDIYRPPAAHKTDILLRFHGTGFFNNKAPTYEGIQQALKDRVEH